MKLLERNAESSLSVNEQKNVEPTARRERVETRGENAAIPFKKRAGRARGAAVVVALVSLFAAALVPFAAGCSGEAAFELKEENGEKYYCARVTGSASALKGELVIPSEYGEGENKFPVREIADQGFAGSRITKVTIPASVNKLGIACFMNCAVLEEVVFESGGRLEEIEWGTFGECQELKSVVLPDTLKTIDGMAFYSCEKLGEIVIPEGVTAVNMRAFESCAALSSVSFPSTLTSIGYMAFYNSGLKSVVIPDSVCDVYGDKKDADGNPVLDADGNPVKEITTPAIGYAAFHSCVNLESAVVGKGVTVIGEGVFGYCTALKEIYLPQGLKEIKGSYFPDGKFFCGSAFHHDQSLKTVYFGGTAEEWAAVKINQETYSGQYGDKYDNSYLTAAEVVFSSPYNG